MGESEEDLKIAINNFVWMHAPGEMTLDAAETLAVRIFEEFRSAQQRLPKTSAADPIGRQFDT